MLLLRRQRFLLVVVVVALLLRLLLYRNWQQIGLLRSIMLARTLVSVEQEAEANRSGSCRA